MADNMFEPLSIRGLTVKNRVAMSPMNRNAAPGGVVGENIAKFYRRRVDGEVGLIFTGGIAVDHPAATGVYVDRPCAIPELITEEQTAGWKRVVDLVHEGGGKIVAQFWHLGVMRTPGTGFHPDAPSARPSGIYGPTDRPTHVERAFIERLAVPGPELTDAEILEIIEAYARTARSAVALGFDGLEIHGANGYLPDSFLWEETNRRTDRWGGNRRERGLRFVRDFAAQLEREPVFRGRAAHGFLDAVFEAVERKREFAALEGDTEHDDIGVKLGPENALGELGNIGAEITSGIGVFAQRFLQRFDAKIVNA